MNTTNPLTITSSRLAVEIAQPGTVYRGTRFDWSGFITQVTLDGKHTFCMPESLEPGQGTGGIGLCNEFSNELTVGYDEAKPGEPFLKLGIGLLKRPDEGSYNFFRPHEIVENFPIHVEPKPDQVIFYVEPIECRGYAARLEKTVSVQENKLILGYSLKNTGTRTITTHEYCHNFLGINQLPIGPDYQLRFPQQVELEPPPPNMHRMAPPNMRWIPKPILRWLITRMMRQMQGSLLMKGSQITWKEIPEKAFFSRLVGFKFRTEAQWELFHRPSRLIVREVDNFPPSRLVVWGTTHVVSAEVYTDIHIQPGESQEWQRVFEFDLENT